MTNMEIFGIVMLVAIAFGLQHLINFLVRLSTKSGTPVDASAGFVLFALIAFVLSCLAVYFAFDWVSQYSFLEGLSEKLHQKLP